jgi:hypothetical protein
MSAPLSAGTASTCDWWRFAILIQFHRWAMGFAAGMITPRLIVWALVAPAFALNVLAGSAAAKTSASSYIEEQSRLFDAWFTAGDDPKPLADPAPAGPNYHLLAVAAGSLAGAVVGIALTGALPVPIGVGAALAPGVAVAARDGAIYAARAVTIMIASGIGGFIASWIYHAP